MSTLIREQAFSEEAMFHFTLVLSGVDEYTPDLEDILYRAGCDDALINFNNGTVCLDFDLETDDMEANILKAILCVEDAPLDAVVESVVPAPYVSMADIAQRTNMSRQYISLLATGERGKGDFPKPIYRIDSKSPLWRWTAVLEWALRQSKVDDDLLLEQAKCLENINAALESRIAATYKHRALLHNKLVRSKGRRA